MKLLYHLLYLVTIGVTILSAPLVALAGRSAIRTAAPAVSDTGAVLGPIGGIPTPDSLIGLLALPTLLEPGHSRGDTARPALLSPPIPTYAAPDDTAPLRARLSQARDVQTREYAYEQRGAIVHEQRPGWYRIALGKHEKGGSAWVAARWAGAYWPLEQLLPQHLSYLTAHWDGLIWPAPGAGYPLRTPRQGTQPREEYPVRITESQRVAGYWPMTHRAA